MKKEKRFEVVFQEGSELTTSIRIMVDKTTGIQYLYVKNGYGGGLTQLLGPDGKPLLWKPEAKEGWE